MASEQVVIVTGGTYGIGRAITITLVQKGYKVVAFGLDAKQPGSAAENGIEGTRKELGVRSGSADLFEADITKADEVNRIVQFAVNKYGRIDGLVNNAGIRPYGKIVDTSEEVWDQVMSVNLKGMFLTTKAVLPYMIEQGRGAIVNISSGSGLGRPNRIAYCASKGGVFAFSAALAVDHLDDHIRVNVVVPGYTVTGMTEADGGTLTPKNVTGRVLQPQDTADVVAFLLSDEAAAISGSVLPVGGPLSAGR